MLRTIAKTIYARYLNPEAAPFEVNLGSDGPKKKINELISTWSCRDRTAAPLCALEDRLEFNVLLHHFDLAKEDIIVMLAHCSFRRYLASREFKEIKDLKHTSCTVTAQISRSSGKISPLPKVLPSAVMRNLSTEPKPPIQGELSVDEKILSLIAGATQRSISANSS